MVLGMPPPFAANTLGMLASIIICISPLSPPCQLYVVHDISVPSHASSRPAGAGAGAVPGAMIVTSSVPICIAGEAQQWSCGGGRKRQVGGAAARHGLVPNHPRGPEHGGTAPVWDLGLHGPGGRRQHPQVHNLRGE